ERIDRDQGVAVMEAARRAGITFLDDARYDDETGTAPISTGYSEVVFGELFAASGYQRDEVVVSNKLWWEFWPNQDAAHEVDESLERMGFESLDLIYSSTVPEHLPLETVVEEVGGLLASGRARHWAIVNWPGEMLERAGELCDAHGVAQPCGAQLPYNLLRRDWVEGEAMRRGLERTGASVVASATLAGGALSGKYALGGSGRLSGGGGASILEASREVVGALRALAARCGCSPAALALAFALERPGVASVLFGATTPAQVVENAQALGVWDALDAGHRAELAAIGQ
ncbi:MAG TPA: aldo/keto reductase, partial [Acidimicrobiales bacterium]|nr:aldo/keto reductase [Acidimicrobiales bacterium]